MDLRVAANEEEIGPIWNRPKVMIGMLEQTASFAFFSCFAEQKVPCPATMTKGQEGLTESQIQLASKHTLDETTMECTK